MHSKKCLGKFRPFMAVALLSVGGSVTGVASAASPEAATPETASLEEVVVTARRRAENLQDVPQTVNAVSGTSLEKLNLTKFQDVQAVVPGLDLRSGNNGFSTTAQLRGAGYDSASSAPPPVEFYLNDAITFPMLLFQSMYDTQQVEVLRGPQGTLRGRAAPSGSITITTRKPDLEQFGGYALVSDTSKSAFNANAAVNIPLVQGVAALRVAGLSDRNELDYTKSINNGASPYSHTNGGRVSLRVEPTKSLQINLMASLLNHKLLGFDQVESLSLAQPGAASGTSRIIAAGDRLGITDGAKTSHEKYSDVIANIDWQFAGQKLSYVGSYGDWHGGATAPLDSANVFPGVELTEIIDPIRFHQRTHELRLSSVDRLFNLLDYTVGYFRSDVDGGQPIVSPSAITIDGGFLGGTAGVPILVAQSNAEIDGFGGQEERSFFGNLTLHLGNRTELSGGARRISFHVTNVLNLTSPSPPAPLSLQNQDDTYHPTVYNFSLSHKISDDLLVYGNTGSSWRNGPQAVGVQAFGPRITQFTKLTPETSKSYEIGLKSSLLDRHLIVNVAAFHQDFTNFIYYSPNAVTYVTFTGAPGQANFLASVPAKINGLEVDATFRPNKSFDLGASFAYAKGKMSNGTIACNDPTGSGVPSTTAPTVAQILAVTGGQPVAVCSSNQRLSTAPDWSLILQPEYSFPVLDHADAFVRGLLSYHPSNVNQEINRFDDVSSYSILNMYLGLRNGDGAWDVTLFAKNVTNTLRVLSETGTALATGVQALQPPTFATVAGQSYSSPYVGIRTTPPREFGISVRYAFGSR